MRLRLSQPSLAGVGAGAEHSKKNQPSGAEGTSTRTCCKSCCGDVVKFTTALLLWRLAFDRRWRADLCSRMDPYYSYEEIEKHLDRIIFSFYFISIYSFIFILIFIFIFIFISFYFVLFYLLSIYLFFYFYFKFYFILLFYFILFYFIFFFVLFYFILFYFILFIFILNFLYILSYLIPFIWLYCTYSI